MSNPIAGASVLRKGLALVALLATLAPAAGRNFGLGVVFPSPTGLSAKLWTSGTTALDFVLGWSGGYRDGYYDPSCNDSRFYDRNYNYCNDYYYDYRGGRGYYGDGMRNLHIHADYLFHNFNIIRTSERFPLYAGPGVALNWWRYEFLEVGVRGDFGVAWLPRRAPMDVYLEVAPVVYLIPYPNFNVDLGLGTRYYF